MASANTLVVLLALCSRAVLVAGAAQECADDQQGQTDCASQTKYNSSSASGVDDCCALCASEKKCQQWTFHSQSKACERTSEQEDPKKSISTFFSTCGIKAAPSPPPAPTPPPSPAMANNWAVIAAGSSGFMNYRHQADACHAYQLMIKSGIAADHIILMMQDDVADSSENPFRGKLFNKMGSDVDVYAGCKVDYRGRIVTGELFTKVITGDESAGGKVLKSGPGDRVFINFVDHGGVGIIAFPNGSPLHAKELSKALQTMQQKKMYNELVFYMEACESGSMFPDLDSDSKIFAVTAANAKESSWGYYCPPKNDTANGKHMKTCLGDLFSIAWMEDSDLGQLSTESIATQVQRVTKRTSKSHVSTFGDKSFNSEVIGHFEVGSSAEVAGPEPANLVGGEVDSRDIHWWYYQNRVNTAESDDEKTEAQKNLRQTLADRKADELVFWNIAKGACEGGGWGCDHHVMKSKEDLENHDCHEKLVKTVHDACPVRGPHAPGGWNSYNMKFSQVLANACQLTGSPSKSTEALTKIVQEECAASKAASATEVVV